MLTEPALDVPSLVIEGARKVLPGVAAVQAMMLRLMPSSSRQRRWLCSASYPASASTVSKAMMAAAWRKAGVKSGES